MRLLQPTVYQPMKMKCEWNPQWILSQSSQVVLKHIFRKPWPNGLASRCKSTQVCDLRSTCISFGHPLASTCDSQVRMQVLVSQTCVNLCWLASPFGQDLTPGFKPFTTINLPELWAVNSGTPANHNSSVAAWPKISPAFLELKL